MVAANNQSAPAGDRQQALEFGPDRGLAPVHLDLVERPDQRHVRVLFADGVNVGAGLALQREDAVQARLGQPVGDAGGVTVGVDHADRAMLLHPRKHPPVVGPHELVEHVLGQHRPVVVAHVLGEAHEVGRAVLVQFVDDLELPVGHLVVHAVQERRLIVKRVQVPLDAQQRPRMPEVAAQRKPQRHLAALLLLPQRRPVLGINGGPGEQQLPHLVVAGLIRDDARPVRRRRREALLVHAQPPLHVEILPEVPADILAVREVLRQAFFVPAVDRQVPPAGPLHQRQPVERPEVQHRLETFACRHLRHHPPPSLRPRLSSPTVSPLPPQQSIVPLVSAANDCFQLSAFSFPFPASSFP